MENREGQQPDPLKPTNPPESDANLREGPPPFDTPPSAEEEAPQTIGQWLAMNGFSLVIVAAILVLILKYFDLGEQLAILKVALGLSFVIFLHELGHFLVAKWCDVHVTTFSIGFGPALPGCSFQWGETTYKISLIPLGGYVQMVGQVDGDEASDGSEDDPRSYRNKSVGQRMAIISAGVIMNVILAVLCFIVVYQGPGKDRTAAVVSIVDTESPAFNQGLRSGSDIVQINNIKNPTFEDLMTTVMASRPGEKISFHVKQPDNKEVELLIEPRKQEGDLRPVIGVSPAQRLQLAQRRYVDSTFSGPAYPETSAAAASPPFAFGDRIVAMSDPEDPTNVTDLPQDPRAPGIGQKDYFAFARRLQQLADQTIVIRVQRGDDKQYETVDIKVPPRYRFSLGARMQMGQVISIRQGSPAAGKVQGPNPETKRQGDKIVAVSVTEPGGKTTTYRDVPEGEEQPLDPERLPHQLKQWAAGVEKDPAKAKDLWTVTLTLRRHREDAGEQFKLETVKLAWDNNWRYDRAQPIHATSPLAIPELGLAYQVQTTVMASEEGSPLRRDDVIKNIKYDVQGPSEVIEGKWQREDLDDSQWPQVAQDVLQSSFQVAKVYLKVKRDQKLEEIAITPTLDKTWALPDRGWVLMPDVRRQKASNITEAVAMGLRDTQSNMVQVFQNLRGMVTGRLSARNLVGPVMIARVSYKFASYDMWEFIFFLGLISVNLAVVNFLPIPVLDGGHMVFLIYEKLRGKPASEGIRVAATYAGLALILLLMGFVFWLDITRLFL